MRILLLALAALVAAPLARQGDMASPPTITFFVGSDSHFGAPGMEEANRAMVEHMNALPGTAYPEPLGGRVEAPRGVLMTGDLTDNGQAWPDEDKESFGQTIDGHNVIAIFHGHQHPPGHYVWRDRSVFRPGAAKSRNRFFLVVRVAAQEMSLASWNFETGGWGDAWSVPVRRGVAGVPAAGSR